MQVECAFLGLHSGREGKERVGFATALRDRVWETLDQESGFKGGARLDLEFGRKKTGNLTVVE